MLNTINIKTCRKCKIEKPVTFFQPDTSFSSGYRARCRECLNAYQRTYNKTPKGKQLGAKHAKKNNLASYGLTGSQYNTLFLFQQGFCKICGKHQNEFKHALAVDHCHKTNKVRGLLCGNCNTGIGQLKDDVRLLQSAIDYLNTK